MRQKPRTLIVIPAFNESPHVLDIVHEIINKTRLPVLVVDDASTDDTVARVLPYFLWPVSWEPGGQRRLGSGMPIRMATKGSSPLMRTDSTMSI